MNDNILKEWLEKSQLDFFGAFSSLYLAFNFWYRKRYGDGLRDYNYINKIENDFGENSLGSYFIDHIEYRNIKEAIGGLYNELKDHQITHKGKEINLSDIVLFDYKNTKFDENENAENILAVIFGLDIMPEKYKKNIPNSILISNIHITNDLEKVFKSLINVIYKIRCAFFHGDLLPSKENNRIVKHCYFILQSLLEGIIWKENQFKK